MTQAQFEGRAFALVSCLSKGGSRLGVQRTEIAMARDWAAARGYSSEELSAILNLLPYVRYHHYFWAHGGTAWAVRQVKKYGLV